MNRYEAAVLDSYLGTQFGLEKDREKFMNDVFKLSLPSDYRKKLLPYLADVIEKRDNLTIEEMSLIELHTGCVLTPPKEYQRYLEGILGYGIGSIESLTPELYEVLKDRTKAKFNRIGLDSPKPIYVVICLSVDEEESKSLDPMVRENCIKSTSTMGYYHDFDMAHDAVYNNDLDIWEYCFNYAVIEEIPQGLYPEATTTKWYKFNAYKDGEYIASDGKYEIIDRPRFVGAAATFFLT